MKKLMNLMNVFRFHLQLEQIKATRNTPNTTLAMILLNFNISKVDFSSMGSEFLPIYKQMLEKLAIICQDATFNITI